MGGKKPGYKDKKKDKKHDPQKEAKKAQKRAEKQAKKNQKWNEWGVQSVGSQTEQQVIYEAQQMGGTWTDKSFPANNSSLGQKVVTSHSQNPIQWKRPKEFTSKPQLFIDGTEEGDVIQGGLGDCWFLGALAVVATRDDLMHELVVSAHPEHGFYQFRFFKNGSWHIVTVDDLIPCVRTAAGKYQPFAARCKDPNELWVALIEKAYAKLHGSYIALEAGWTADGFVDLTGGVSQQVDIKTYEAANQRTGGLWGLITMCINEAWLMGCSSSAGGREQDSGMGILTGHAYSIIDAKVLQMPNGQNEFLVRIRNPWGKKEWTGRWSDTSRDWTPFAKQALNYRGDANDGTFWMNFQDFQRQYTRIFICRIYNDLFGPQYYRYMLPGEWVGSAAGGSTNNIASWKNNPQYGFTVQESCHVCISLTQEDPRMLRTRTNEYPIAFTVFSTKDNRKRIETYPTAKDKVATTGTYDPSREVIHDITINPGQYHIVPSTFQTGQLAKFWLVIYSLKPITFHAITNSGVVATGGNALEKIEQAVHNMNLQDAPPAAVMNQQQQYYDPYYGGAGFGTNPAAAGGYGGAPGGFPAADPYASQAPAFGGPPPGAYGGGYGAPPPDMGYGAPPPGAYGAPPAMGYGGAPPPGAYGAPPDMGYGGGFGAPPPAANYGYQQPAYGAPGAYGAPPDMGYGAPPQVGAYPATSYDQYGQGGYNPIPPGGY